MASVAKRRWTSPSGEKKEAWVVRYKDDGGAHRARTFPKKKEADAFRAKAETELASGTHIAYSQTITVAKLIDTYLETAEERFKAKRRMSKSHLDHLNFMLRNYVSDYIGAIRLLDLSIGRADDWARRVSRVPTLAPQTVKRIIYLFKHVVDFAIRREWVHRNVVAIVLKDYRGGEREAIRTFSEAQVRTLIIEAAKRPPNFTQRAQARTECMVYLAAFCGLRYGEIAALKVENIDFDRLVVKVRHSLTPQDELKGPKTRAGIRDVPIPAILADKLREWIKRWYVPNDRGLVFRLRGGGFQCPTNFHTNYWRKLLDRAGLGPDDKGRRFHFHALRHFCASMMVKQGVPLPDVAELLGHSSFDTTLQVYAHALIGGSQRQAIVAAIANDLIAIPGADASRLLMAQNIQ